MKAPEIMMIPISDLLLDGENPRIEDEQETQQKAAEALAEQQGDKIIRLIEDIAEHGVDPLTLTGVLATEDRRKRYRVIEGNRRVLALRALETPTLISPVLSPTNQRKLNTLSSEFAKAPITELLCARFDSEDDALHWVSLKHTGENQGKGTVGWDSEQQARFSERHAGIKSPARQVLDFVTALGNLSPEAEQSSRKIITSVQRLLTNPEVRERLGIEVDKKDVLSYYPREEVAKGLTRVVEDLKTGKVRVPDLYHVEDRQKYAAGLSRSVLPTKKTRLKDPVLLEDLSAGQKTPRPAASKKKAAKRTQPVRTTVVPKDNKLDVTNSRINQIFAELAELSAEKNPNACSVLLRVFLELSVDHYLEEGKVISDQNIQNYKLGKRIKILAKDLLARKMISIKLKRAIERFANNDSVTQPGLVTFHQYVHNKYVFPSVSDLYTSWDELEPMFQEIWPAT